MAGDATKPSLTLPMSIHANMYLHNTTWCAQRKAGQCQLFVPSTAGCPSDPVSDTAMVAML